MFMRHKLKYILIFVGILFLFCNRSNDHRKIKLSDDSFEGESDPQLSTTIYLEEQQRRSLAVFFFQNKTGDQNLEWLKKGLTEMFIRALSQYNTLSVLGTDRLYEIAERIGKDTSTENMDLDMAVLFAKEANVETILTGNITKTGDSLQINVSLHEPGQSMVLSNESVEGPGMENLFAMVDQLTQKLKNDLQVSAKGREDYKRLADFSTESIPAWRHYTAGMVYKNKFLNREAFTEFQQAIEIDSTFVSAHYMLAMSYLSLKNGQKAMEAFRKASSLREKATLKEKYQIDLFEAVLDGNDDTVTEVVNQMHEDFPCNTEFMHQLANYYYGNHRYEEALELYKKVLQIDPKHKVTLNQIAYLNAFLGNFGEAKKVMKKYIELVPDEPNPYDSMGEILWIEGKLKEAESYFKKALQKNELFSESWGHLGQIYLDLGKYKKAYKTYQDYLDIVPGGAQRAFIYYMLGVIDLRRGNTKKALKNFEQTLEEVNFFTGSIDRTAEIFQKQKDEERLQDFLNQHYEQILEKVNYHDETMGHITALFNLSTQYGIHPEKTLEVINHALVKAERTIVKLRGIFMQTLLELHMGQAEQLGGVWRDANVDYLIQFLEFSQSFGYMGFFRHFYILNQFYKQHTESGILFYNYLISKMSEANLKPYEMGFRGILADLFIISNNPNYAKAEWQQIGMPSESSWRVIGPFDNKKGFLRTYPPEKELKWNKIYKSRGRKIGWMTHEDGHSDGFIDLKQDLIDSDWAVAYAVVDVLLPDTRHAWIRLGATDPIKVWINGKEVWRYNRYREALLDDDIVQVSLNAGKNRILIKVCQRLGYMGYYFRLTDEKGNGFNDVKFQAPDIKNEFY